MTQDKRYSDARLEELEFLMGLAQNVAGWVTKRPNRDDAARRRMIAHLVYEGYINDIGTLPSVTARRKPGDPLSAAERDHRERTAETLDSLLGGQPVQLSIGHRGLLRIAELRQQLRSGRDRDPSGVMISKRHLESDLAVALLGTDKEHPLAIALLDMNGLKTINDTSGHGAGDDAIQTYLEAIAMVVGGKGESYRGDGGDEVFVLLPGHNEESAETLMRNVLVQLGKEKTQHVAKLTAACGVDVVRQSEPLARMVLDQVDAIQYRAKEQSKKLDERPSTLAVGKGEVDVVKTEE